MSGAGPVTGKVDLWRIYCVEIPPFMLLRLWSWTKIEVLVECETASLRSNDKYSRTNCR